MEFIPYDYFLKEDLADCEKTPSYIALGFFDGVHLGHQALLKLCVNSAEKVNASSTVILLDPHPEKIINKKNNFHLLTTLQEKAKLIKKIGIQKIVVLSFNEKLKNISGENFIKEILLDKFNMSAVFTGYNYRFGYRKEGDINLLKLLSKKYNYKSYVLEPIKMNGEQIISSTIIRECLKNGDIDKANKFLGYNYQINGEVVHGDKRGKRVLNFPTANIKPPSEKLMPHNGVYIALIEILGEQYQGLVNIGTKPTFNNESINNLVTVEAHIFNYDKYIYGKNISVSILKKVREEEKFNSFEELIHQIQRDKLVADAYFMKQARSSVNQTTPSFLD